MPRGLVFVLVLVFLDAVGFGIVYPPLPRLIMELTGEDLSAAARYFGWLMFVYALLQFFAAPVLGNLSDRFGRRPVLLLSLAGFSLDYLLMGLAPTLVWLFVGRAFAGIFGATFATANAFVSDITPPDDRAKRFGVIGAAWGVGFIVGPALGGVLGQLGTRVPFFVAAGLALANVTYGAFALPESLDRSLRRPLSFRRAHPIGAFRQMSRYPIVIGLIGALAFYQIAHDANPSTWTYYMMEKLRWTQQDVGFSMAAIGLGIASVQALLLGSIVKALGERATVFVGYAINAVTYAALSFVTQGWMVYACIVPFAFGTIANPTLKAIMSRQVPADAQGELQGAIASLMGVTAIVAPIFMTQIFSHFTQAGASVYFPGAPFFAAGVFTLAALTISAWVLRK